MLKVKQIWRVKWIRSSFWIVVVGGIILISLFSIEKQLSTPAEKVKIEIEKNGQSKILVTKEMIHQKLNEFVGGDLEMIQLGHLDLKKLEEELEKDSRIENVELYMDGQNAIHVDVTLKKPIVRIMSNLGEKYYLDFSGERIELAPSVAIRVPLVTGDIHKFESNWKDLEAHNLQDVYKVASVIREDPFLSALIEQIHVDESGMITVIPKIGRERIFVGTSEDLDFKMENLKLSYKYILNRKGWGKYKELKLDIPNQVIALS